VVVSDFNSSVFCLCINLILSYHDRSGAFDVVFTLVGFMIVLINKAKKLADWSFCR